jgi:hypothetical protein
MRLRDLGIRILEHALLGQREEIMKIVYQVIDDCIQDNIVYDTKEAAAMRVLDIVMKAKDHSMLNDLLRVYSLEVR